MQQVPCFIKNPESRFPVLQDEKRKVCTLHNHLINKYIKKNEFMCQGRIVSLFIQLVIYSTNESLFQLISF